jgi:methylenetetrahydrofolate reductase (NADPH)
MKVIDHINSADKPFVSFEILPPVKGKDISHLFGAIDPLMDFNPPFINVTYHRAEYTYKKRSDGLLEKVYTRKRPGTVGICAAIQNKYGIDAVPHMTCGGFTKQETEDAMIDLSYLGIDNCLILRGDPAKNEAEFIPEENGHHYAIDFVKQVQDLNNGNFLEDGLSEGFHTNFCCGVAGYPEKHYESPNMDADLLNLKKKVDAGAEYIVTQLFFDNAKYFEFVKKCREIGITVPIIPGLKPIATKKQLTMLPRVFNCTIPEDLAKEVAKAKDNAAAKQIGIEWAIQQSKELMENDVPCLHFYTMSRPQQTIEIVKQLF